jgi:hypothetical protein
LGEPTFAREFRNIQRYQQLGIPALEAVFFGERKVGGERQAILMTRALDGWNDLDSLLEQWPQLSARPAARRSCGLRPVGAASARCASGAWLFLPQAHLLAGLTGPGYRAQLIDLEKTRPLAAGPA